MQALGTRYSGTYSPPTALPADPPNPSFRGSITGRCSTTQPPALPEAPVPEPREIGLRADVPPPLPRRPGGTGGKRPQRRSRSLIGETSPGPGRKGTDPITFLRGVFCLNAKFKRKGGCAPIDADGWAQHPYDPFDAPFESSVRSLLNLVTIGKLIWALHKARAAGAAARTKLPIYVTEYGVESVPDRRFGVSQLQQAEYISISEYLMYRNPTIRSFGQYLMQDDVGNAQVNFQTGLRFSDGRKKISYAAFPIALVAQAQQGVAPGHDLGPRAAPGAPFTVTVKSRQAGAHTIEDNAHQQQRLLPIPHHLPPRAPVQCLDPSPGRNRADRPIRARLRLQVTCAAPGC